MNEFARRLPAKLTTLLVPVALGVLAMGCSSSDDDNDFQGASTGANLTVTTFSLNQTGFNQGDTVTATYEVRNMGTGDAGNFRSGLYQSIDTQITTSDTLLNATSVAGLQRNQRTTVVQSGVLGGAAGTVQVGVLVDDTNLVSETNETDNSSSLAAVLGTGAGGAADLTASGFSLNGTSFALNDPITSTVTITNQGAMDAGAFRVGEYCSTDDAILTTSDTLSTSLNVGSLGAGTSMVINQNTFATVAGNATTTGAIVDDLNTVAESDETNNASNGVTYTVQ
jgi:subtilase family serine protease